MPKIIQITSGDEAGFLTAPWTDDGSEWWSGVAQSFVSVAIASALVVASACSTEAQRVANSHQDDPSGLHAPIEEDYVFRPYTVPPGPRLSLLQGGGFGGTSAAPTFAPEEDVQLNQVPPPKAAYALPPWLADEQTPTLAAQVRPLEDFWQNQVPSVPTISARYLYPEPFSYQQDDPQLKLQPDEDFWWNQVAYVPTRFLVPSAWAWDEQTPTLYAPPEEDYWQNQVASVTAKYAPLPSWLSDEQTPTLSTPPAFQPDEDFWQQFTQRARQSHLEIIQSGASGPYTVTTAAPPVEDFWTNQVPYAGPIFLFPQPWSDEQTPTLSTPPPTFVDEDLYTALQPPEPVVDVSVFLGDDNFVSPRIDEDFWVNQVAYAPPTYAVPSHCLWDEQIPQLRFQPDEDFWTNQVAHVPTRFLTPQPWAGDEQTPTLSTPATLQFDEDFWNVPTPPFQTIYWVPQPWAFDEQNPVLSVPPGPTVIGRSARFGFSGAFYR